MSLHPTIFADTESGPEVWIRIEGRGSFQNSPALKEFSRKMIGEGRRSFVVDLKNCPAMDSTFMGTLAGLAIRLRDTCAGELWVVNRNERNADLLAGLGLDPLFSDKPLPAAQPGDCKEPIHHAADKASTMCRPTNCVPPRIKMFMQSSQNSVRVANHTRRCRKSAAPAAFASAFGAIRAMA